MINNDVAPPATPQPPPFTKARQNRSPLTLDQAREKISSALASGKLCLVLGKCKVSYVGRAASKLSQGDRLVVIKPDGTFLVHQKNGMKAINYQGPGSVASASLVDGCLSVVSKRSKPLAEEIVVAFTSVDFADCFSMSDDSSLQLFGSEKELAGELMKDLHLIESGLKPINTETHLQKGAIDILAEDKAGNLVVIEVKRRDAGLDAVTQLKRYVEELQKRKGKRVRGILCSPNVTPNALKMLEGDGFEYFKLDYEVHNPKAEIKGLQRKQKELGDFNES